MKKLVLWGLLGSFLLVAGPSATSDQQGTTGSRSLPASPLFDPLGSEPDVVYLIANSSVVFGPDPHARSEEITFVGPVTVPKWPMKGYGRRILPDGRQQIDIELTQSELTGESYVLHGPVVLGEHPDLRSLGTITERPPTNGEGPAQGQSADRPGARPPDDKMPPDDRKKIDSNARPPEAADKNKSVRPASVARREASAPAEEVPADFVVERKVLMTTAKGILYNETAVPVRGRIDAIPPIKLSGTPTGVNTFRGMELPVALLDRDGNVNGWFYSKAHMAYAVLPAAVERSFMTARLQVRAGDKTETIEVAGPAEIHHLEAPKSGARTKAEVMVLALRGRSELLGGDVMIAETFSDRDRFSRGELSWTDARGEGAFDLFIDVYTPSTKLTLNEPLRVSGAFLETKTSGQLQKGRLTLPFVAARGTFASDTTRALFDEAEKPVAQITGLQLTIAERR